MNHLVVLPGGSAPITRRLAERDHPAVMAQLNRRTRTAIHILDTPDHPHPDQLVAALDLWGEVGA